jgi:hypothetical protein
MQKKALGMVKGNEGMDIDMQKWLEKYRVATNK